MNKPLPFLLIVFLSLFVSQSFGADQKTGVLDIGVLDIGVPGDEFQAAVAAADSVLPGQTRVVSESDDWSDLAVLWIHQGDSIAFSLKRTTVQKIRQFVESGRGLYLSGASWPLLNRLSVEKAVPRSVQKGDDRVSAAIIPVNGKNGMPSVLFKGLLREQLPNGSGPVVFLTDGGYSAFCDFHATAGPADGALLANSATGGEKPVCEYELGKGRIVAVGWRLTNYRRQENVYRENLFQLTANILNYLQTPSDWEPIVVFNPNYQKPSDPAAVRDFPHEIESLRLAIDDLIQSFPEQYTNGKEYLDRLGELEKALLPGTDGDTLSRLFDQFDALKREALLANPLVQESPTVLAIRRRDDALGLPANWESDSSLRHTGYDNEIVSLPIAELAKPGRRPDDLEPTTVYRPDRDEYVGELDLDFDANRILFSQPALRESGGNGRWQLFELALNYDRDDKNAQNAQNVSPRLITTIENDDVDNYDGCYLPDGRIIFTSTAPMIGVPCVRGASHVTNTYVRNADGTVRQLTFDQEHNWNPTVMPNGRIMYLRWEYTDTPHAFYRLLFTMNPDGTNQVEYYGSNSYWPNCMFNAKPAPGAPNRFFAIVVGHHDVARAGELVLFDSSISNFEADGAVQKIGQRGKKVEPVLLDGLTGSAWPKFLHPAPLSDKYVLTACKTNPSARWGIYLVDVFDNFLLLYDEPGYALLEPVPLKQTPKPPAIADRTDPNSRQATVFLADIYAGPGLKEIRRGEVKQLRVFTYDFSYHEMGGQVDRVGWDGPWDVRAVLGTVPVEPDGSAHFTVPANVPIALQPLDETGAALQLMRSWFTAMPGEVVSCVGCHQRSSLAPVRMKTQAGNRAASEIVPFYGTTRGFSFRREIQPVLDKYCVGCHNNYREETCKDETCKDETCRTAVAARSNLSADPIAQASQELAARIPATFSLEDCGLVPLKAGADYYNQGGRFSQSYINLRRFVRGHTIESDAHLLSPREFHVNTTRLFQTLRGEPRGHYGVARLLSKEDWDRLTTWVDMNTPFHGTWAEISGPKRTDRQAALREELRQKYAGIEQNQEQIFNPYQPGTIQPVLPAIDDLATANYKTATPCRREEQRDVGPAKDETVTEAARREKTIRLPNDQTITFVYVPQDGNGLRGFWMSQYEITNEQYQAFDPKHDSRYEFGDFLVFSYQDRGYQTDGANQPVVRVSFDQAQAFCRWLTIQSAEQAADETTDKTTDETAKETANAPPLNFALPTAEQWAWAARGGTGRPDFWYGDQNADFSKAANLSDKTNYVIPSYAPWGLPSGAVPSWRPADIRFDDKYRATAPVGSFAPNPFGLYDMHGNAAEWALPTAAGDGKTAEAVGGSFDSRPAEAAIPFRRAFPTNQPVYDVGFRVVF